MPGSKYDRQNTAHISEGRHEEVMKNRAVYGSGDGGTPSTFVRYVILDVISDPGAIDKTKLSYWEHVLGVSNIQQAAVAPRNSIIAAPVHTNTEAASKVMVLYPFFPPHLAFPAKPGEHVWVMFENPDSTSTEIGYWMCRIVQPHFVEDVNYTHADRQFDKSFLPGISDIFEGSDEPVYEFRNGAVDSKDGERYTIGSTVSLTGDKIDKSYDKLLKESDASLMTTYESVPRYRKRPADTVFEGSNNTLIVLGTDRTGPVADYEDDPDKGKKPKAVEDDVVEGAGVIDMVAGRGQTEETGGKAVENKIGKKELGKDKKNLQEKEGNVDFKNDRARVLIAQKTKGDKNFKVDEVIKAHTKLTPVEDGDGEGFIVVKTDKVRLIARHDVVILVTGAKEKDDSGNVKDADAKESDCASIIVRANGDIIFTPSQTGVVRLGGEDATLSPLCTRVSRAPGMPGPLAPPPPIVDTMGGAQGAADGLNGTFATKVLLK